MSKLLDTWAWIEFYEGSKAGEKVYGTLEGETYTSIVTLAELSDNYHRGNFQTDHSWNQVKGFIQANTEVLQLEPETVSRAGKIKAEERVQHQDFGLMDAMILATAREKDLELLTGDPHLTEKDTAKDLRK